MEQTVTYSLMVQKSKNSKQKILKLFQIICAWEMFQKKFHQVTWKKENGFNGHIYDFNIDYDTIDVDDILDIHMYLMKKNEIV